MKEFSVRLEQYNLYNNFGDTIRTDVRFQDNGQNKPIIIICHSFMAFKNWGFFPYLAERLAKAGFISVIFNFSLNGVTGDGNRITDFERFSRNTFSRELHDLETVISACVNGAILPDNVQNQSIGLLGHSRGGGIAIVTTAANAHITSLATLASISTFDRWRDHQKTEWRKNGFYPLARHSHISPLRLGIDILNEIELHADSLSIAQAASRIQVPWLILHGKTDGTVHIKEAEELYHASGKATTELNVIEHAGHLFNAASPDEDNYTTLNATLELIIKFYYTTLVGERYESI